MAATDDFVAALTLLKGSAVNGALALKVARAFVYAYPEKWEQLVVDAGFEIERADPRDLLSVGTYDQSDPPVFTPVTSNQLNQGLATHGLNRIAWFVKHITVSQWKIREAAGEAGDTPEEAAAKAEAAASTTADSAANDERAIS